MWSAELAAATRELEQRFKSALAHLLQWRLIAAVSPIGEGDAIEGTDEGVDPNAPDNAKKGQRPVTRLSPFGFVSVPVRGLRALALRLGTSNMFFIGIGPTQKYGPQDLAEGESAVYNITSALVRLWKTGKLTVDADTGQDVVINGGTAKVGRVGDSVTAASTMATWISNLTLYVNGLAPGTLVEPTDFGTISSGADHFKG